eukprot:3941284-Rhodomonas_salina.14
MGGCQPCKEDSYHSQKSDSNKRARQRRPGPPPAPAGTDPMEVRNRANRIATCSYRMDASDMKTSQKHRNRTACLLHRRSQPALHPVGTSRRAITASGRSGCGRGWEVDAGEMRLKLVVGASVEAFSENDWWDAKIREVTDSEVKVFYIGVASVQFLWSHKCPRLRFLLLLPWQEAKMMLSGSAWTKPRPDCELREQVRLRCENVALRQSPTGSVLRAGGRKEAESEEVDANPMAWTQGIGGMGGDMDEGINEDEVEEGGSRGRRKERGGGGKGDRRSSGKSPKQTSGGRDKGEVEEKPMKEKATDLGRGWWKERMDRGQYRCRPLRLRFRTTAASFPMHHSDASESKMMTCPCRYYSPDGEVYPNLHKAQEAAAMKANKRGGAGGGGAAEKPSPAKPGLRPDRCKLFPSAYEVREREWGAAGKGSDKKKKDRRKSRVEEEEEEEEEPHVPPTREKTGGCMDKAFLTDYGTTLRALVQRIRTGIGRAMRFRGSGWWRMGLWRWEETWTARRR